MESTATATSGLKLERSDLITYVLFTFLVVLWCRHKWNLRRFEKLAAKMTGPPAYPIIGSGLQFIGSPERTENIRYQLTPVTYLYIYIFYVSEVMDKIIKLIGNFGPEPFKVWLGSSFGVAIIKPEDLQVIYIYIRIRINAMQ